MNGPLITRSIDADLRRCRHIPTRLGSRGKPDFGAGKRPASRPAFSSAIWSGTTRSSPGGFTFPTRLRMKRHPRPPFLSRYGNICSSPLSTSGTEIIDAKPNRRVGGRVRSGRPSTSTQRRRRLDLPRLLGCSTATAVGCSGERLDEVFERLPASAMPGAHATGGGCRSSRASSRSAAPWYAGGITRAGSHARPRW
jgi:hypothetical protein